MKQRKSYDLSAISSSIKQKMAEREAFVPYQRPAICRAAIQLTFDPAQMEWEPQDKAYLETNSTPLANGHWELKDDVRRRILLQLKADRQLLVNYTRFGNPNERYSKEQGVLGAVLKGWKLRLQEMTTEQLKVLFRVKFWVDGGGYDLPSHEVIRNILGRHEIADKFRRQTSNFSGRTQELNILREYVFAPSPAGQDLQEFPPLLVYGIGGIGKSTLISKFLLDEAIRPDRYRMPFVYLDFDHPGLTISNPLALFAAGMRQLAAQFPAKTGEDAPLENALGDLLATQSLRSESFEQEKRRPVRKGSRVTSASWRRILSDLSSRHLGSYEITKQPILIVLDSFEEAQYRTGETAIRNFLEFLNELTNRLPNLRLLIVGRSDLVVSPFRFQKLPVGNFDAQAAQAYLKALGVKQAALRSLIQMKVGGNPLTLKLAAALAEQEGVGSEISLSDFAGQLAGTQVQELLVRRNVEHIRDPEVQQLALPGMLLRRIDAEVIQHILAPVCGLGEISAAKAQDLFEGLQRVTFLIEMVGGELHFRRDLRIALREEIWRKQQAQCITLHRRAADYYHLDNNPSREPKLMAEHYYHVLQLDGKPWADADSVDWKSLRPFLEDALMELPPRAAAYLARKFSVRLPAAIMNQAGQEENDWSMVRRMEEVAVLGFGGVEQMTEVWEQVRDRTESNEFFFIYYRQLLALRLGYFDLMLDDLSPRAFAKLEGMDVYLNLLRHNYQGTYQEGLDALKAAGDLKLTGQQRLELGVLLLKFHGLQQHHFPEDWLNWFVGFAANFPDNEIDKEVFEAQTNWRPYTARLFEARKTNEPAQRAEFEQICRDIHAQFTALSEMYLAMVATLSDVAQDRFSLVLQNETKRLLEDIAAGGIPEVNAHDYADFLMEYFNGDEQQISAFMERVVVGNEEKVQAPSTPDTSPPLPGRHSDPTKTKSGVEDTLGGTLVGGLFSLDEAFDRAELLAKDRQDESMLNEVLLLRARYNSVQKRQMSNTYTSADGATEEAKIKIALTHLFK